MSDLLKPCPFCGGEANGDGYIRYNRPLADTQWADGSEITEAFYVNCIKCGIDNGRSGLVGGYQTKAEAIAQWNTRTTPDPKPSNELVERVATRDPWILARKLYAAHCIHHGHGDGSRWDDEPVQTRESWVNVARAALSAIGRDNAVTDDDKALAIFTGYFVRNYPGPKTIIHDPHWHAPKIFRAAASAMRDASNKLEGN